MGGALFPPDFSPVVFIFPKISDFLCKILKFLKSGPHRVFVQALTLSACIQRRTQTIPIRN
ncbi:hypothetical protein Hanom_Chr03g00191221 [Helianthus anomalus]